MRTPCTALVLGSIVTILPAALRAQEVGDPALAGGANGSPTEVIISSETTVDPVQPRAEGTPEGAQSVQRVLARNHGQIGVCHETELRSDPSQQGIVRVEMELGPAGRPTACTVSESPVESLGACVCASVRRLVFPPPDEGTRPRYELTFHLHPGAPRAAPRPGCGRVILEEMPARVQTVAMRIVARECLGERGSVSLRAGWLEVWYDGGRTSPGVFVAAAGGRGALRAAGLRGLRVHVTGGPMGEFDVLPTRAVRAR